MKVRKRATLVGHGGAVYGLCEARDPGHFYSASSDGFIASWSVNQPEPLPFSVNIRIPAYSVLYHADDDLLFAGNGKGGVHVIAPGTKTEVKLFHHHSDYVFTIAISPKHDLLISGSADGTVSVNRLSTLTHLQLIRVSGKKVRQIKISEELGLAAIACGDGYIYCFSLDTFSPLLHVKAHELSANALMFMGDELYSGGRDAMLKKWSVNKDEMSLEEEVPAHNFAIYQIQKHPNGVIYATASRDKTIKLWEEGHFKPLARIDFKSGGHLNSVNTLLWTGGNTLISAGDDKKIMVWEIL